MKIYLAGPLFTIAERKFNVSLAWCLRDWGHDVWIPQEKEPRELTAKAIFDMDVAGIDWADVVVACMDGPDPDSGTCFECGYAYAKGKPFVAYRTDFRSAGELDGARYNLMMWASATANVVVPMNTETPALASLIRAELDKIR